MLDKLKFWKKHDDFDDPFADAPLDMPADLGLPPQQPGSQDWSAHAPGTDDFKPQTPQFSPMDMGGEQPHQDVSPFSSFNSQSGQQQQTPFGMQQDNGSFAPQQLQQAPQQREESIHPRDIELILSKIETLKSNIDHIATRVEHLEQTTDKRRW